MSRGAGTMVTISSELDSHKSSFPCFCQSVSVNPVINFNPHKVLCVAENKTMWFSMLDCVWVFIHSCMSTMIPRDVTRDIRHTETHIDYDRGQHHSTPFCIAQESYTAGPTLRLTEECVRYSNYSHCNTSYFMINRGYLQE